MQEQDDTQDDEALSEKVSSEEEEEEAEEEDDLKDALEVVTDLSSYFEVLQEDYHNVLAKLEKCEGMAEFKDEYNRLFEALVKFHKQGQKLQERCNDLDAEVSTNISKLAIAVKLSANDRDTIDGLKQEIEAAWKMLDGAHVREQDSLETIEKLRKKVAKLTQELEEYSQDQTDDITWSCEDCNKGETKTGQGDKPSKVTMEDTCKQLKELRSEQKDLGYSLEVCHCKLDDTQSAVNDQKRSLVDLLQVIDILKSENNKLKQEVDDLKRRVEDIEQYPRLNSVEIHGVPETQGESTEEVVGKVIAATGVYSLSYWYVAQLALQEDQSQDSRESLEICDISLESLERERCPSLIFCIGKSKEGMVRETEKMVKEIEGLRDKLASAASVKKILEEKAATAEARAAELAAEVDALKSATTEELRAKDRMDSDIKRLQMEKEAKAAEISNLNIKLEEFQLNVHRLENSLKEQKVHSERVQQEIETITSRSQKIQLEYDAQIATLEKLMHENSENATQLKIKEEEISRLRNEVNKTQKIRDNLEKKLKHSENQLLALEREKERLQALVANMERDLNLTNKQVDQDKHAMENLGRERDVINKTLMKTEGTVEEQKNLLRLQEQVKQNLEKEIEHYVLEAAKQRKIITALERERDKYITDSSDLNKKIQDLLDEVKLKQMDIFDLKKKLQEADAKLRQQKNLFDSVRSDRNTFSKRLLEVQDENTELKQRVKIMSHQIDQLKEDIAVKERDIMREQFASDKAEKETENLRTEMQQMMETLEDSKAMITQLQQKEISMQKVLNDAEAERSRQAKSVEQIMNERDILGTQLIRRNDELALLYEKIKILQSTLMKGEAQYDQRLEDIRLLKLEIKRLRHEKLLLSRSMTNMSDLRQEIFHLERDLTRERLKCKALEEELHNPLNIHRWRKLEGSDPSTFELIQKIQLLQKRLVTQSTLASERENQLREAERLYMNLRQLMERQPGPAVAMQLHRTQLELRDRGRKMRCLISELNMYETKVTEYKFDLERVNHELQEMKKKYYTQIPKHILRNAWHPFYVKQFFYTSIFLYFYFMYQTIP
ncbi:cilia- and flagella-associated protein 58 [Anabrus simplex]|uniref:cilia- and flagella-associated protein 58 n=1 Tax=Anabrus simplex TaxID=316456 RepID=UPI0035A2F25D